MSATKTSGGPSARFNTPAHHSRLRVIVMVIVGVAVAVAVGTLKSWAYAPAMGWAAASLTYLIWVWSVIGRLQPEATAAHALREDPGRGPADALVLVATVASFSGVALILLDAADAQGGTKAGIIAMALGSVALSWFLVHTLFTLRYASIYYRDKAGVDFNEDKQPRYMDFAYLAFTVGMTYQVSDTDLKTDAIRTTVLRQALLSFLLGTIVLATTINLVAGLIH
ncbi:DUF1345 domain-containing protein [Pseudarthrobacter sp. NIBRBAC000502770]|uniref:DUF1345 domain-containing protein n=1 Tax=Pseudarthrobacter sp. NIBRBAC000502770 TaxID=2590785 RepID=UPI00113FC8E9|nr:DUF1345 domain-containing protein [Pseudarthrobacter sp. NIBRBAC000502770]QDG89084.1 DUF1345 domain-containing protein [Pseudarthrobacter sp. NIBRBAC000502770]